MSIISIDSGQVLPVSQLPTAASVAPADRVMLIQSGQAVPTQTTITALVTAPLIAQALGFSPLNPAQVGVPGGIAPLDGTGKVPTSMLPDLVSGAINFAGTWNASTNTPVLADGVGQNGAMYRVAVAGSTPLGGVSNWTVGDLAIFASGTWCKIDGNPNEVLTVAGRSGNVLLAVADVAGAAPLSSPGLIGTPTAPTPSPADNSTRIATTGFVKAQGFASASTPVSITGDVSGVGTIGSPISVSLQPNGVTAGTFGAVAVDGTGRVTAIRNLSSADVTDALGFAPVDPGTVTSTNTANAIVARDRYGNFQAGTVSANLQGNASTASKLAISRNIGLGGLLTGTAAFDGSGDATIEASFANGAAIDAGTF